MDRNEFRVGDRVRPKGGGPVMTVHIAGDPWIGVQDRSDGLFMYGSFRWQDLEWAETPDWVAKLD